MFCVRQALISSLISKRRRHKGCSRNLEKSTRSTSSAMRSLLLRISKSGLKKQIKDKKVEANR
jgi:hypothetical protein